jgi:hypothetical protein
MYAGVPCQYSCKLRSVFLLLLPPSVLPASAGSYFTNSCSVIFLSIFQWMIAPSANLPVAACLSSVSYLPDTDTAGPLAHLSDTVLVQIQ